MVTRLCGAVWRELARRLAQIGADAERGTVKKEALIAVSVFFGFCIVAVTPFLFLYADSMPVDDQGRSVGARRAMAEDPVVLIFAVATTIVGMVITEAVFRRLRPRFARKETEQDVAAAARVAAHAIAAPGTSAEQSLAPQERARAAAVSYLRSIPKRSWPYEADRVWATVDSGGVEVIAERSFQKPTILWHPGSREPVARMDVQARARSGLPSVAPAHPPPSSSPPPPPAPS